MIEGELGYSSRATESQEWMIGSQAILACLRGGIAEIYAQKKLDKLDKGTGT